MRNINEYLICGVCGSMNIINNDVLDNIDYSERKERMRIECVMFRVKSCRRFWSDRCIKINCSTKMVSQTYAEW